MHISRLALDHYRSWSHVVVDFVPGVNILFGKNGLGKTNLVEAIYLLTGQKSFRQTRESDLVNAGRPRPPSARTSLMMPVKPLRMKRQFMRVVPTEPASTRGRRCICAISSARFPAFPSLPKISGWYPAIREHAAP